MALTEPQRFLAGLPEDLGMSAELEDACLAYSLFDQVRLRAVGFRLGLGTAA